MLQSVLINSLILMVGCLLLITACAPTGIYHTVQPGQTLYRIAKTYEVDERRLARVNRIKDPNQLKVSQKLFIPGVTQRRNISATTPTSASTSPQVATAPVVTKKQPTTTRIMPAVKTPTPSSATAVKSAKGIFVWPVKGTVLNKFGAQGQNIYKGIEIDVPEGTSVVAAASGKVIYSGNAIPGYGNLVILEHSDSYFSVYGYNQKTLVKSDDHVGQGEKIALSGLPPNGQSARLHFEIRKGKSAVNPILYLP
ncbi:MAG: peptidoglycan DD-metalloendopeptidase family protein [Desulfuromonadales bacterium]|nr:peptidoglycan DD-metalloendopeptidase family protein [Desulfuromonadales bacterium]